jgi:hypothetical protein
VIEEGYRETMLQQGMSTIDSIEIHNDMTDHSHLYSSTKRRRKEKLSERK